MAPGKNRHQLESSPVMKGRFSNMLEKIIERLVIDKDYEARRLEEHIKIQHQWLESISQDELNHIIDKQLLLFDWAWSLNYDNAQQKLKAVLDYKDTGKKLKAVFDSFAVSGKNGDTCWTLEESFVPLVKRILPANLLPQVLPACDDIWQILLRYATYPFLDNTSKSLEYMSFVRAVQALKSKRMLHYPQIRPLHESTSNDTLTFYRNIATWPSIDPKDNINRIPDNTDLIAVLSSWMPLLDGAKPQPSIPLREVAERARVLQPVNPELSTLYISKARLLRLLKAVMAVAWTAKPETLEGSSLEKLKELERRVVAVDRDFLDYLDFTVRHKSLGLLRTLHQCTAVLVTRLIFLHQEIAVTNEGVS